MHETDPLGPSTLMSGLAGTQAVRSSIHQILEKDFNAIEVCPTQFQQLDPLNNPQFLTSVFNDEIRKQLKELLSSFHYVSVHGSSFWVTKIPQNIDPSSIWTPYLELMEFASDIGADVVSFHPIQCASTAYSDARAEEGLIQINIDFGKRAAAYAHQRNLKAAFENMPGINTWMTLETIIHIIDEINSPQFGVLFDLGHAMLEQDESIAARNHRLLTQLYDYASKTLQYHFHGLYLAPQGYKDHGPLHQSNHINYERVKDFRRTVQNRSPIIFEIYHNPITNMRASFEQNLAACLIAQSQLTSL
jgi:sugar phosphate isomerase/epimerase